ncbi:MAG TPA: serine--tRNA ligase [Candidatus Babeliales bacterium]|nr:serine--tRNA ligase [Candidatus Babeliales bacterium]
MIDLRLLRDDPDRFITSLKNKDYSFDAHKLVVLDEQRRVLLSDVERLRHEKNELADQIARQGIKNELREKSIEIGKLLKEYEKKFVIVEKQFHDLYLSCPNLPADDLPIGGKEANLVVSEVGHKPVFDFPIKNHLELGKLNSWFDFEAAAQMTGSNFVFYMGDAVRLMYALAMFMLKHNQEHGFTSLMLPPYLVNEQSLEVASNFPKFRDQVYAIEQDNLYLIPTAEVSLTNIYRNIIFEQDELPKRMTSWTSCFRREAGGYGSAERGLIRIHQFEKVELYTICLPEDAEREQERMLACAEEILKKLELHYRVSLLATQDCSFPSAKTYDLEVWMPGQDAYYEVSSISNCTDFQSRRGGIRYRENDDKKIRFTYTLNGSSLALPRLIIALMETYQQNDGSIIIPEVLKPYILC